jgi:hypothetical protein
MKKSIIIGLIIGIVVIVAIVLLILSNKSNESIEETNQMVDCGMMTNPECLMNRMNTCLPVTGKLMATDEVTEIGLIVLGVENETCHFQRSINNTIDVECYFPGQTITWNMIDQLFGNEQGVQSLIDTSCTLVQA